MSHHAAELLRKQQSGPQLAGFFTEQPQKEGAANLAAPRVIKGTLIPVGCFPSPYEGS
jgi:hypothetical protein